MDFDKEVNRIGRRKAVALFVKRIAIAAVVVYLAIAAYGRWHKPEPEFYCPCPECLCEHTDTQSAV